MYTLCGLKRLCSDVKIGLDHFAIDLQSFFKYFAKNVQVYI